MSAEEDAVRHVVTVLVALVETPVLWEARALKDGESVEEKEALEESLAEALDEPDKLTTALTEGLEVVDPSALAL